MHCIYKIEKEIKPRCLHGIGISIVRFIGISKKSIHIFMVYSFCLVYFLDFQKKGILFCSFMNKSYNILLNLC